MLRSYSVDLRERVARFVESGASCDAAAARFGVSVSFAVKLMAALRAVIPWERLPFEVAGCSGMTCQLRLRDWQDAGLWDKIHRHMLDRLNLAGQIDWSRASVDASSVPAKRGATRPARTRLTAASRAPSATSWSIAPASLSLSS